MLKHNTLSNAMSVGKKNYWKMIGLWILVGRGELNDDEYSFSVNVLTGQAKEVLPNLLEGRIRRTTESRPITFSEMFSLKGS